MDKILILIIVIASVLLASMVLNIYNSSTNDTTSPLLTQYSKKPKFNDNQRVVVTMWVDKDCINNLDKTLKSLLEQTVKVDMIYVNVAPETDVTKSNLVDKCAIIQNAGKYYPENDRLFLTMLIEKDANTVIIEVSPGQIYDKDFIEKTLQFRQKDNYVLSSTPKVYSYMDESRTRLPRGTRARIMDPNNPGVNNMLLSHAME